MSRITAFDYPTEPLTRRHGPYGYPDYKTYRDWLRDEFCFRCFFCLRRETWGPVFAVFHIDHQVPQAQAPDRVCDYTDLLYLCATCNCIKSDLEVPDPAKVGLGKLIQVREDGTIEALHETGELLIERLRLDDKDTTNWRGLMLETLRLLNKQKSRTTYKKWMGFPEKLPNLRKKNPPGNHRPEGIEESWFARRERGELPETY